MISGLFADHVIGDAVPGGKLDGRPVAAVAIVAPHGPVELDQVDLPVRRGQVGASAGSPAPGALAAASAR